MPAIYSHELVVSEGELDPLRHVNNVTYVQWLQDAAIAHSTAQGWPMSRYHEEGWAWVVRRHTIEYLAQAFFGNRITVRTWIADMQKVTSRRKYLVLHNDQLLARAETNWAFIRTADSRLVRVPDCVSSAFQVVGEDPNEA